MKFSTYISVALALFLFVFSFHSVQAQAGGTYGCTISEDSVGIRHCVPFGPPANEYTCDVAAGYDAGGKCGDIEQNPPWFPADCMAQVFPCELKNPPTPSGSPGPSPIAVPHQCNSTGVCTPCVDPQNQDCNFSSYEECAVACQDGGTKWGCTPTGCAPLPNGQYSSQVQCFQNCGAVENKSTFQGSCGNGTGIDTAIGCIPINTFQRISGFFISWGLGIGGGIAFLTLIVGAFLFITSNGNPEQLNQAKEILFSAVSAIFVLAFAVLIFRVIGMNVLGLF